MHGGLLETNRRSEAGGFGRGTTTATSNHDISRGLDLRERFVDGSVDGLELGRDGVGERLAGAQRLGAEPREACLVSASLGRRRLESGEACKRRPDLRVLLLEMAQKARPHVLGKRENFDALEAGVIERIEERRLASRDRSLGMRYDFGTRAAPGGGPGGLRPGGSGQLWSTGRV